MKKYKAFVKNPPQSLAKWLGNEMKEYYGLGARSVGNSISLQPSTLENTKHKFAFDANSLLSGASYRRAVCFQLIRHQNGAQLLAEFHDSLIEFCDELWSKMMQEFDGEQQGDTPEPAREGVHREQREETKWYNEWCGKYLLSKEINRQELTDEFVKWRLDLYPYDTEPDLGLLRTALSKRRKKWGVKDR